MKVVNQWTWLHYNSSRDLVFCHTCVTAIRSVKLDQSKGNAKDSVFASTGFSNWKDATVSFSSHVTSLTAQKSSGSSNHLLYERTERFVGIHVVKCVACKNAGAWAYIITVLLGQQENIKKSLFTFMHNNAKKLQRKFQQY